MHQTSLRTPPIVGRENELAAVRRALDGAADHPGTCLFLVGEAGAGKTRLLREAQRDAKQRGMTILTAEAPTSSVRPWLSVSSPSPSFWTRASSSCRAIKELRC
jgi:hypothetical protein